MPARFARGLDNNKNKTNSHKKNNKNNNLENYFTQDQGCKSRGQGLGNSVLHVPHQLYKAWTGEGEEEDLLQIIDVICPNMMHHHNQIEKVFSTLLTDIIINHASATNL